MATSSASSPSSAGSCKLVLITGASRGLGRALAIEFVKRGHTVAGCARSAEKLGELEKLLSEDGASTGKKHLFHQVDVSSDSSVESFAKRLIQVKGVPDIIVNNAGIINRRAKIWELSAAEVDAVIDTNLKGTINVIRHFLPLMKQGTIVNFSSIWGRTVDNADDATVYCASKFGIEALTKSLAKQVPEGVVSVSLDPGAINTDMLASRFSEETARLYQSSHTWAIAATDVILALTPSDNGASLTIETPSPSFQGS